MLADLLTALGVIGREERSRSSCLYCVGIVANENACGQILDFILPVCKFPMKGATKWSLKAYPDQNKLRMLVKLAPDGYVPAL